MAAYENFTLKDILERQKEVTDKISTQTRSLSLGIVVFSWAVLSAQKDTKLADMARNLWVFLALAATFAIVALTIDYIQYVLAKKVVDATLNNPEFQSKQSYQYPTESLLFKAQYWCFWGKQILCGASVFLVLLSPETIERNSPLLLRSLS